MSLSHYIVIVMSSHGRHCGPCHWWVVGAHCHWWGVVLGTCCCWCHLCWVLVAIGGCSSGVLITFSGWSCWALIVVGGQWCWALGVISKGVVLGARRHWCHSWVVCCCGHIIVTSWYRHLVTWCCPAIIVAWLSSVVVVVVVSHCCCWSFVVWKDNDEQCHCSSSMLKYHLPHVHSNHQITSLWTPVFEGQTSHGCYLTNCIEDLIPINKKINEHKYWIWQNLYPPETMDGHSGIQEGGLAKDIHLQDSFVCDYTYLTHDALYSLPL